MMSSDQAADQMARALAILVKRAGGKVVLTSEDYLWTASGGGVRFGTPTPDGSIEITLQPIHEGSTKTQ